MKKLFLFIFCLCPCAAAQQPAVPQTAAQTPKISVTAQYIPQKTPFAGAFDTRFELSHLPEYVVELDKESMPEGFTLTAQQRHTLSPGTTAYELTFMPFTLGISTFTALTFELKEQSGGKILDAAQSAETHIDVTPVQYFKKQSLLDIRPPYIPSNPLFWFFVLVVFALIVYTAYKFYKTLQNKSRKLTQMQDNRPPDVIALSKIEALLQSGLWEHAQYKLFYIELGEILREYFWRRFGQDVSSDTSAELLRRARRIPQLAKLLLPLREYLNSSDLVKFAKVTPTQDTMRQDVNVVRNVVKQTSPQEEMLTKEDK